MWMTSQALGKSFNHYGSLCEPKTNKSSSALLVRLVVVAPSKQPSLPLCSRRLSAPFLPHLSNHHPFSLLSSRFVPLVMIDAFFRGLFLHLIKGTFWLKAWSPLSQVPLFLFYEDHGVMVSVGYNSARRSWMVFAFFLSSTIPPKNLYH